MKKKTLCVLTTALACASAAGAATNYDLLGRKASKMNSPMVYKDVDYKAVKKSSLSEEGPLAATDYPIVSYEGDFDESGYNYNRCARGLPTSTYLTYMFYYSNGFGSGFRANSALRYFSHPDMAHTPVRSNDTPDAYTVSGKKTATDYNVSFSKKTSIKLTNEGISASYNKYVHRVFPHYSLVPFDRSGHGFPYDKQKVEVRNNSDDPIGIYVDTKAYPAWMKDQTPPQFFVLDGDVYNSNACQKSIPTPDEEYDATLLYYALPNTSAGVYPFFHNSKCESSPYPTNPSSRSPQIYMGIHAAEKTVTDKYTDETRVLDNYVYDNHTVEVVAAGNISKGQMNAKAYAANAITVGFVDAQNRMGFFSSWKNAPYTNAGKKIYGQKPEIANYTDFSFYDKATLKTDIKTYSKNGTDIVKYEAIDGTAGAAAYTAIMLSELIRRQPFMRYHPEVVKARLLTSSVLKIASDDNQSEANGIPYYPALLGSETINQAGSEHYTNKSMYIYGDITKTFSKVSGINQYEYLIPVTARQGYKYRAAISWLSSGDDIAKYNRVPQDFDLFLVDSDGTMLAHGKNNGATPYELLSYTATKEQTVYARILLYEDINSADSPRYHQIKLGLNILEYKD